MQTTPVPRLTRDTLFRMRSVTIRELRNRGGEVIDRAAGGESITITRAGEPVATLTPLPKRPLSAEALLAAYRDLPSLDLDRLRRDIDAVLDPSLPVT